MKLQATLVALSLSTFFNAFAAPSPERSPESQGTLTQVYTTFDGYATFASNNYLIGIDEVAPNPKDKCSAGDLSLRVMDRQTGKKLYSVPVGSENKVWDYNPRLFNDKSSDTVYVSALYFNNTADCDQVVPLIFAVDFGHQPDVDPKVTQYKAAESYFETAALPSEIAIDGEGVPSYIVDQYTSDKNYAVNWICTIRLAKQTTECLKLPVYPSYYQLPPGTGTELVAGYDRLKATRQTIKDQHRKVWEELTPKEDDLPEVKREKLEALKMVTSYKAYHRLLSGLPEIIITRLTPLTQILFICTVLILIMMRALTSLFSPGRGLITNRFCWN